MVDKIERVRAHSTQLIFRKNIQVQTHTLSYLCTIKVVGWFVFFLVGSCMSLNEYAAQKVSSFYKGQSTFYRLKEMAFPINALRAPKKNTHT